MAQTTDESKLWDAFVGDKSQISLRNQLIEMYMPYVEKIAGKIKAKLPRRVRREDLVSSGIMGLIQSVETFEPARGVSFKTFSAQRIRGAIIDDLRLTDTSSRIVRRRQKKLESFEDQFEVANGRKPDIETIAEATGLTVREISSTQIETQRKHLSLVRDRFDSDGVSIDRFLVTRDVDSDPAARQKRLERLRSITVGLNRSERLVILLYYFDNLTMLEIGKSIGVAESRVSQIRQQAIRRIRERVNENKA
jgi:RNA polymerase sigma factor for flagellar operon FliA